LSKINAHPEHLRRSGGKLGDFGGKLADGGDKLQTAGQNLVSHASGDRSGIGAVVAKAMGKGIQITGKVFSESGRVVQGAGKRLGTTADLYEEADERGASLLKRHHPDPKGNIDPKGGGGRRPGRVGGSRGSRRSARSQLGGKPRPGAVPKVKKCVGGDPVDLATGDVLMTQLDLALPGVLAVLLSRTHQSSYRTGLLFGASWASTLDQRLEIDGHGVVFVGEDGLLLAYPIPEQEPVLPAEGPRWPLRRAGDGFALADLDSGRELTFAPDGELAVISDRIGHRVEFDRDAGGNLLRLRHSGGYVVDIDTADGVVAGLSVAGVPVARYGYDDDQNLVEVTDPEGRAYRFDYDADGRLTRWTDRNGRSYRYRYDSTGRCVASDGDDGLLTATFEYGESVTTMTNSLGQATTYHFNDALQLMRVVDPLGGQTVSEWDAHDRLLARTDPLGRTTRYEYTDTSFLQRLTRPDRTQTVAVYGEHRLPDVVVEPDGAEWRRAFDHNGNTIAVTDPTGETTRLDYDEHGHIAAVTDPTGATTRFDCDAAGQTIAVTDPLGAVTRYERNELGQVVAITDALGGVTRLTWTIDGRPTERVLPDVTTERWTYDGEGNETSYTNGFGQIFRTEYGGFDLPLARIEPTGARTEYRYDTELRLTAVTDPTSLVWRYDYDAAGNLVGETDVNGRRLTYTRDAGGQAVTRVNGAGQSTQFRFDSVGRLVRRESADTVTTFAYDPAGRLVRATNQDTELTFTRDVLGEVVAEACDGRVLASAFDALARKIARTTPTGAVSRWAYDQTRPGHPSDRGRANDPLRLRRRRQRDLAPVRRGHPDPDVGRQPPPAHPGPDRTWPRGSAAAGPAPLLQLPRGRRGDHDRRPAGRDPGVRPRLGRPGHCGDHPTGP
jgi:YD repeat-containing protein